MGGEDASVPISNDPKPEAGVEAAKADETEPKVGYGWDAEIDETEFGAENTLDEQSSIDDNSPDPPLEEPAAETPPPSEPIAPPSPAAPPAPPPVQPPPAPRGQTTPLPSLPHDDSPVVRMWTQNVLNAPVEQRQQLLQSAPGDVGKQVMERLMSLDQARQRFASDPYAFIGELAESRAADLMEKSVFADRFKRLEAIVLGKAGEDFLAKHKITESADRQHFNGLIAKGLDAASAAEIVAMKRRLGELEGTSQRVRAKETQIEATKASARAQQSGKGKGRATDLVGQRAKELEAAGTNPLRILQINEKYESLGLPAGRLKRTT